MMSRAMEIAAAKCTATFQIHPIDEKPEPLLFNIPARGIPAVVFAEFLLKLPPDTILERAGTSDYYDRHYLLFKSKDFPKHEPHTMVTALDAGAIMRDGKLEIIMPEIPTKEGE